MGNKSLQVAELVHIKLVKPVLPYAEKPYSYISPYVAKADELASQQLSKVDEKFPIMNKETDEIKGAVVNIVYSPLAIIGRGKGYVDHIYGSEYKKCGGNGLIAVGKALITTSLIVTSDTLEYISKIISQKKEEAKDGAQQAADEAEKHVPS